MRAMLTSLRSPSTMPGFFSLQTTASRHALCQQHWSSSRLHSVEAGARAPSTGHSKYTAKSTSQSTAKQLLNTKQWPLLSAVTQKQWEACQQLLGMGSPDPWHVRYAAAMFAAYEGQAQLVTALLQSAAAMPPDDGRPSSHLQPTSATIAGVECGSDDSSAVGKATTFRLKRQALERGLWWALSQKHTSTCLALIESCPELLKASWLHSSLRTCLSQTRGNIYPVFEAYLRKGGSNQQVYSDLLRLALMDAAVNCDHGADRLRFLIQLGADVNAGQRGFTGDSPLAAAIMRVCTTNIQILLDHGAHVHADPASSESKSALQLAIGEDWSSGDLETCKVLLSYERVQVGGAELCAAVDAGQLDRLQLLLGAERNHIWPLLGSLDTSGVVPKDHLPSNGTADDCDPDCDSGGSDNNSLSD